MSNIFSLSHYSFHLPEELIADAPVEPRDHSKLLLVNRKTKEISHHHFYDLPKLLPKGALLFANNSKVIRARIKAKRILSDGTQGGKVEFFLLEKKSDGVWEGLLKSSAEVKKGFLFTCELKGLEEKLVGEVIEGYTDLNTGTVVAKFNLEPTQYGEIPLPPYIEKKRGNGTHSFNDQSTYQTLYAKQEGSVAAPTAGLHFTDQVFEGLKLKNISWHELTLHVGLGTFRPVKSLDIREHKMHEESFYLSQQNAQKLNQAKKNNTSIGAVGTTSLRVLESVYKDSAFHSGEGRTGIFIYPGGPKKIEAVDFLITNFHLPESTLLMLVCSFSGTELIKKAYQEAIERKYRFYSYGDAMLII